MQYNVIETMEAVDDVINFASYMIRELKNQKAAADFLDRYDNEAKKLGFFRPDIGVSGWSIEDMRLE